ncbi:MAG: translation initiation factor IF-2, partial [Candidatus Bathyarchaeia archaeon]
GALAGSSLYAVPPGEDPEKYARLVSEEIEKIRISTDTEGIILKADTLGSLEAIAEILKQNNVQVRIADVGDISKRDVIEASIVKEQEPLYGVILAFNVKVLPDAQEEAEARKVQIFREQIIYHLVENYLKWLKAQRESKLAQEFENLIKPGKIRFLEGYVFRRAKPAIFGVEILGGQLKPKYQLIRAEDGADLGEVQQIQDKGKAISEAKQGMQVAISMDKPIVGRHIFEKDIFYVKVPESDAKALLTMYMDKLTADEQEVLKEYAEAMRKKVPFWGA